MVVNCSLEHFDVIHTFSGLARLLNCHDIVAKFA